MALNIGTRNGEGSLADTRRLKSTLDKAVLRLLGLTALVILTISCSGDSITPPSSPSVRSIVVTTTGERVELKDVPELTMGLPPTLRPWDESDSALVVAMNEAGHKAFVAFKRPGSARAAATARMARLDLWSPPGVMTKQGTRASVDAGAIKAGLAFVTAIGGSVLSYYESMGVAYIDIEPSAAAKLRGSPLIDYVEPDLAKYESAAARSVITARARHTADGDQVTPWGVTAVRAPQAWSLSNGFGARLLIIDTGHDQNHSDLDGVPISNCFGSEGGCDDGSYAHGTWVSGVAIARDNGYGVVGVAPGLVSSDVYYWGACRSEGDHLCIQTEVIAALNWAASNLGARSVINMSLLLEQPSSVLANAASAALRANNVLIAPVGNQKSNTLTYPAALPDVVGVSGLNSNLSFAAETTTNGACGGSYSNYGYHVDLSAPFDAYTTQPVSYVTKCGTSIATPHVAGTALLVRALHPEWSRVQVVENIIFTAQNLAPGGATNAFFGYGIPRADLATGLYRVTLAASFSSQNPMLSWDTVPLAAYYRIYRLVWQNGVSGNEQLYSTTYNTTWIDSMQASSGGLCDLGSGNTVVYRVTAVTAGGIEGPEGYHACFIPIGIIPE